MTPVSKLVYVAYNVIWWVPVVLAVLGVLPYSAAAVSFLAISVIRAAANFYRNNVLTIESAQRFPLRSP